MRIMKSKNKYKWIGIILLVLLLIGLIPVGIDWLIIGNDFPSNVSNASWVGFLGGYIGAIIGGVITLIGVSWTIRFTREQNRADHELQVRPSFDIVFHPTEEFERAKNWLGYISVQITDDEMSVAPYRTGTGRMRIKNVGNGPATNIDIVIDAYMKSDLVKYYAFFTNQNLMVTTNSIRPEETADVSLEVVNRRHAPAKENVVWEKTSDGFVSFEYDDQKFKTPDSFRFDVTITYNDLLGNVFSQRLSFSASYGVIGKINEDLNYHCNITLNETGSPKKEGQPSRRIN